MVAHVARSESGVIRRMLVSLLVVTFMAIGLRAAAAAPGLVASAVMVLSLVALGIGLFSHGRAHSRRWRRSWTLLAGALFVQTVVTTQHAVTGLPRTFPVTGDWVGVVGECAVLIAL